MHNDWFMFRCKDVSRMSWTARWVTAALLNSPTEAACPIWRPPLGKYYGFGPWHLYSSPTWLSVTPGTAMLTEFTLHEQHTHLIKPCWHSRGDSCASICETWPGCVLGSDLESSVSEWSLKNTFTWCTNTIVNPMSELWALVSAALEVSQWGGELESSSTCGLCTMMRRSGRTQSGLTPVRANICPQFNVQLWKLILFSEAKVCFFPQSRMINGDRKAYAVSGSYHCHT